jgi:hypothetical protein
MVLSPQMTLALAFVNPYDPFGRLAGNLCDQVEVGIVVKHHQSYNDPQMGR